MNIVERWYCPVKDIDVKIFKPDWHYEEHIMSRGEKIVHYHLDLTDCVPYKFNWDRLNKIGHDNSLLDGRGWLRITQNDDGSYNKVYTDTGDTVEERGYCDRDYVVMGKIGKENWIKEMWEKLVEVKY